MQDGSETVRRATAKVAKIGDEYFATLPIEEASRLGLNEGDEVELVVPDARRAPKTREEALEDLRRLRGIIPADYKFKREDAYD
jgi:antitoxin MazE